MPAADDHLCPSGSEHIDCSHLLSGGLELDLWRRRWVERIALCPCACHARCPVVGPTPRTAAEWDVRCTCVGADDLRAERREHREYRQARQGRIRIAMLEAAPGLSRPYKDFRSDLELSFRRHDAPLPGWVLDLLAGTAAAGNGSRLLRLPRMAVVGLRFCLAALRAAPRVAATAVRVLRSAHLREDTGS